MMYTRLALALAVLATAAACGPQQPQIDLEAERQALLERDRACSEATVEGGIDAWTECFAENGMMLPASYPPAQGHDEIRRLMGPALGSPDYSLSWKPQGADVAASVDLGYTWGLFEVVTRDSEGQPTMVEGKYLSVWRKQEDGSWKIEVDIGNTPTTDQTRAD